MDTNAWEVVVPEFDSIGTWYLYECGMDVPELPEIEKRLPIHFVKNDDANKKNEKNTSFFLQKTLGGEEEANDNRWMRQNNFIRGRKSFVGKGNLSADYRKESL